MRTTRWLWRALWSALLAGSWLWPTTAGGQTPCNKDHPDGCVILPVGKSAPFTGVLLNVQRSADLTVKAEQCQQRIDLGTDAAREKGEVKLQAEKDRRRADQDAHALKMSAMRSGMEAYKERFAPKWYEHPVIWFALGMAATAATIAGSVAIIDATRPTVVQVP